MKFFAVVQIIVPTHHMQLELSISLQHNLLRGGQNEPPLGIRVGRNGVGNLGLLWLIYMDLFNIYVCFFFILYFCIKYKYILYY